MTAQVFRNGQQPTFYVSDALSPSGGGIAGTFSSLTVPGVMSALPTPTAHTTVERSLIVNQTTPLVDPITVVGLGNTSTNELTFTDPSLVQGSVGINTFEASPAMFVATSAGLAFKVVTGGIERLRVPSTGMVTDVFATRALALVPGGTIISERTMSAGVDNDLTKWQSLAGIGVNPTALRQHWMRNGDMVTVSFTATGLSVTGGVITVGLTVPIPSPIVQADPLGAGGSAIIEATGEGLVVTGNSGTANKVHIGAGASAVVAAPATISGTYMYSVS